MNVPLLYKRWLSWLLSTSSSLLSSNDWSIKSGISSSSIFVFPCCSREAKVVMSKPFILFFLSNIVIAFKKLPSLSLPAWFKQYFDTYRWIDGVLIYKNSQYHTNTENELNEGKCKFQVRFELFLLNLWISLGFCFPWFFVFEFKANAKNHLKSKKHSSVCCLDLHFKSIRQPHKPCNQCVQQKKATYSAGRTTKNRNKELDDCQTNHCKYYSWQVRRQASWRMISSMRDAITNGY